VKKLKTSLLKIDFFTIKDVRQMILFIVPLSLDIGVIEVLQLFLLVLSYF